MLRIFIFILILIIASSYILPADTAAKISFGPQVQQWTKQAISWSIVTIDNISGGWFTNTFKGLKDQIKEDIKDSIKDAADEQINQLIP